MCAAMLLGTTYAWFTDTVASSNNIIKSGTLDVELYYQVEGQTDWTKVTDTTNVFKDGALWEPGYTEVVKLKVVNEGNLALKYQLGVNVASETGSVNVYGDEFKLSDYIKYGVVEGEQSYTRDEAISAVDATATTLNVAYGSDYTPLLPTEEAVVTMVVYMPTTVDNIANHAIDAAAPEINLGINLFATQYTYETDSFDNKYDAGAPYNLPAGVGVEDFEQNNATVYVNGTYYATLKQALEGVHANAEAGIALASDDSQATVLYLKPNADLGTVTHAHVCSDLTVYGNGAYISGGEGDFEVDTYKYCHNGAKACAGLTGELTLTVYDLGGVAVWGQRTTENIVNVNLYNCEDVNRVYISGEMGTTNVTIDGCTYDGTTGYYNTAVYTNNPGTLNISNTTITAYAVGINQNNKSEGVQNINLTNCTFIDCATPAIAQKAGTTDYAAPVRVIASTSEKAVSNLTMMGCSFKYSNDGSAVDGNVLITDKREGKANNGTVNLTIDGKAFDSVVTSADELTAALATGNVLLSEGEYTLPLNLNNVTLTADGDVTVSVGNANQTIVLGDNVELKGITFSNNSTNKTGVVKATGENIVIEGCTFELVGSSVGVGIGVDGTSVTVKDCTFTGGYKGIAHTSGNNYDLTVDNCTFNDADAVYGIHVNAVAGDIIIKNSTIGLFNTFFGYEDEARNTGVLKFENCEFVCVPGKTNVVKLYRDAEFVDCTFEEGFLFSNNYANQDADWTFTGGSYGDGSIKDHFLVDSFSCNVTAIFDNETWNWDKTTKTWAQQ